jgi:hypothetical protein
VLGFGKALKALKFIEKFNFSVLRRAPQESILKKEIIDVAGVM